MDPKYEQTSMCRICLKQSALLVSLRENFLKGCVLTIVDVIKECLSIHVTMFEHMSTNICDKCLSEVKGMYNFRENCLNAEKIILKWSNQMIKPEINEDTSMKDKCNSNDKWHCEDEECSGSNDTSEDFPQIKQDETEVKNVEKPHELNNSQKPTNRLEKKPFNVKQYRCNYCDETFNPNILSLKNHLFSVHNACRHCYTFFATKQELDIHRPLCATVMPNYECKVCKQPYTSVHHGTRHFLKCRENFLKRLDLLQVTDSGLLKKLEEIAIEYSTLIGKQRCSQCQICGLSVARTEIQMHLNSHRNKTGLIGCGKCEKGFSNHYQVKLHMKRMHRSEYIAKNCKTEESGKDSTQPTHQQTDFLLNNYFTPTRFADSYMCNYCEETFSRKMNHEKHLINVHKACPRCEKCFKMIRKLIKHRTSCASIICEICKKKSSTVKRFNRHFIECAEEYLQVKDEMDTKKRKVIEEKYRKILAARSTSCVICKETVIKWTISSHSARHLNDSGHFSCPKCETKSKNYRSLQDHYVTEHDDKSFVLKSGKEKIQQKKIATCRLCSTKFSCFNDYRKHITTIHTDSNGRVLCSKCPNTYPNYKLTLQHLKIVHKIQPPNVQLQPKEQSSVCSYCGRKFKSMSNLVVHIKSVHTKEKNVICPLCSAGFMYPGQLRVHMSAKHSTERNLQCGECDKKFSHSTLLQNHKYRCHSGCEAKCKICSKIFSGRHNLYKHMKAHGTKKFLCQHCDKRFYNSGDLKRHTFTHTGEKPLICRFCTKGFAQHTSRRLHEERHHSQELPA